MPLPTWDDTDRLLDEDWISDEWIRKSDYDQLLAGLAAVVAWFDEDHSPTTGIHDTTYAITDFTGDGDTGSISSTSGSISTSASNGGVVWVAPTWPVTPNCYGHLARMVNGANGGTIEILPALQGSSISPSSHNGAVPSVGTRRLETGSANPGVDYVSYRVPSWSPEVVSPLYPDYGATTVHPYEMRLNRARFTSRDTFTAGYKKSVTRAMYRQCWRLIKSLLDAIQYEHSATGISYKPSLMRLYGRQLMAARNIMFGETLTASQQFLIGPHAGAFLYPLPFLRFCLPSSYITVGLGANHRWLCLPAFDDTNAYLDVQEMGDFATYNVAFSAQAAMISDSSISPSGLPDLDLTSYATQGHRIRLMELQKIYEGLQRYKALYGIEHDFATGGHRFPMQRLENATKVFDANISVPATIANVAYTSTGTLTGSSNAGSYTDVTITDIEDIRAGGDVYFVSMKGAAGSGIAAASLAVSPTKVKVVTRRKTAGTTNTFALRVWRVDH